MKMTIDELVARARADGASDIHLINGLPPKYRRSGMLENMTDAPLSSGDCVAYAKELAGTPEAYDIYLSTGELDAAETFAGNRCRIHIFRQQGMPSVALRILSDRIPRLETLGLPPAAMTLPTLPTPPRRPPPRPSKLRSPLSPPRRKPSRPPLKSRLTTKSLSRRPNNDPAQRMV